MVKLTVVLLSSPKSDELPVPSLPPGFRVSVAPAFAETADGDPFSAVP
jgi:hypothetical protein